MVRQAQELGLAVLAIATVAIVKTVANAKRLNSVTLTFNHDRPLIQKTKNGASDVNSRMPEFARVYRRSLPGTVRRSLPGPVRCVRIRRISLRSHIQLSLLFSYLLSSSGSTILKSWRARQVCHLNPVFRRVETGFALATRGGEVGIAFQ